VTRRDAGRIPAAGFNRGATTSQAKRSRAPWVDSTGPPFATPHRTKTQPLIRSRNPRLPAPRRVAAAALRAQSGPAVGRPLRRAPLMHQSLSCSFRHPSDSRPLTPDFSIQHLAFSEAFSPILPSSHPPILPSSHLLLNSDSLVFFPVKKIPAHCAQRELLAQRAHTVHRAHPRQTFSVTLVNFLRLIIALRSWAKRKSRWRLSPSAFFGILKLLARVVLGLGERPLSLDWEREG
jgi:hypothetical protein